MKKNRFRVSAEPLNHSAEPLDGMGGCRGSDFGEVKVAELDVCPGRRVLVTVGCNPACV